MQGPVSEEPAPTAPEPTLEVFQSVVGQTFTVGDEGEAKVELTLAEATKVDMGPHAPRPSFSLLFHGPADPLMPQATYRFEHGSLGVLEIFIVPLGRDEHSAVYEAVFS